MQLMFAYQSHKKPTFIKYINYVQKATKKKMEDERKNNDRQENTLSTKKTIKKKKIFR